MKDIDPRMLSQALIERYLTLPQSPDDATWTCGSCGTFVRPLTASIAGNIRYVRQKCACQKAEEQRQEQVEVRQHVIEYYSTITYGWLGERWASLDLKAKTFEQFDATRQPEGYETATMFARQPEGNLVLHGTYGTGKTHLLAAICNAVLRGPKMMQSLFITSPLLFRAIQSRIQQGEEYDSIIDRAMTTPLFVLDDVDKAKWSEFREEIYFAIIDQRVKAGRPTAISTNRLDQLADFVGGAVCSRLKIGQIDAEMVGQDYREDL